MVVTVCAGTHLKRVLSWPSRGRKKRESMNTLTNGGKERKRRNSFCMGYNNTTVIGYRIYYRRFVVGLLSCYSVSTNTKWSGISIMHSTNFNAQLIVTQF